MKRIEKLVWMVLAIFILQTASFAAASVTVSPASVQIAPGAQVQFNATGATDGVVIWGLSGTSCSGISCGSISSQGLYTAPATAPSNPIVTVTATSLFDLTQSGTATVTIGSAQQVAVSVSPTSVTLVKSTQQQFTAHVTGSSNTAVTWSVSGAGCVGVACGTVTTAGLYTAPAAVPTPAIVTVKATSVADTTKSASASVVIQVAATVSVAISPTSAQVNLSAQQQFSATVTGTTNTAVTWSLKGSGCSGATCGTISTAGLYTAPAKAPSPATVTVTATSVASSTASASATITINSTPTLTISPSNPQIKPGAQVQFSASGTGSGVVVWSTSGSGCVGISCGSISSTGLYMAPATPPSPATVVVTATSLSNGAISGSTTVSIVAPGVVTVSLTPTSASVSTGAQQQFKATVGGTTNTAVTWSVSGFGCGGSACGTITTGGLYTAPATVPNPSFVSVTATSVADTTKSATATVTLSQKVAVSVSPATLQLAVGASHQFTATVTGTPNTALTWSVSGSGCAGTACGVISTNGLYTAPAALPNPATVKITALSSADGVTSGSATVTLLVPVTVTVTPPQAIVTVKTQQQFRASVTGSTNVAVTWSLSGTGCTGTACGTITTAGLYTAPASVPSPATVTVKATSQANTAATDTSSVTIAASNNSKLQGQYAFQFTGFDSNGIYQAAGSLTADGQGKITSGKEDVNSTAGPATAMAIAGTYTVGGDNRGVMTISSPAGSHIFRFALNTLGTIGSLVVFDNSGLHGSGVIKLQDTTAFDPSLISGGYVLSLAGMDSFGSRIAALGLIFPSGSGFISGASLDVNDGGSVSPTFGSFFGQYDVDGTGRGTAMLTIPGFDGGTFNFAFYVVSTNELLFVSVDQLSFENPIFSGPAEFQTGTPFTTTSFNGGSVFNFSGTNGSAPQDMVGRFNFNGSSSTVTVNFDENNGGAVTIGGVLTGAYDLELNGRGTLNLTNQADGTSIIWYMYAISPNEAFVMDASTAAVSVGEMKPQLAVLPFSNSNIVGTYVLGSDEPIVASTPLAAGVANFDGGSSIQGQGVVSGTQDVNSGTTLTAGQTLAGTYSVSSVSNNGRGVMLLTSPGGKTIAVWVTNGSEFVGLNVDSTTPEPAVLHFNQ